MLTIPCTHLPEDPVERHAVLRNYFCDKDAAASKSEFGWNLSLSWPDDRDRHVDPALDAGLTWWGEGVQRDTMALVRKREGRILRCLYDTWTIHSWSEWLARKGDAMPQEVTILHVDDHRDFGSPRLFTPGPPWTDAITGKICDLSDPASILAAIESGAISMGSFLTPFLYAAPHADVRHLCQPPKARSTKDFSIRRVLEPDTLIAPGRHRPAIGLESTPAGPGAGRYRVTPHVEAWLDGIGPGPILLHIDMDYFNNRYDGDSDWRGRTERLDPNPERICAMIDRMTAALDQYGVFERIEDVVIAYSPGFFPAELWPMADERLMANMRAHYG